MFNDDLSPCRTASVLASCKLQPAILMFYERRNSFNNVDPPSGTDVIQSESPENFVVIFEILPIDKEWKSNEITYCKSRTSCGFNDMNASLQVDFPHRLHSNSNSNSSTVFCFTEQNSNSVSFSQSECCRLLELLLTRFSSEVDVVRWSCPSQVSSSPLSVRFSIEWLAFLM